MRSPADASNRSRARNRTGGRLGVRPRLAASAAMLALFTVLCLAVNAYWPLPFWILGVYAAASAVTAAAYAIDKSAAKSGAWRISENTLLTLGFVGGWLGALITQQLLRHKTQKRSFLVAFWGAVWANALVLVAIVALLGTSHQPAS